MIIGAAVRPVLEPPCPASAGRICAGAFWKKTVWQIGGVRARAGWIWVVECRGGVWCVCVFLFFHFSSTQPPQPRWRPLQPRQPRQAGTHHTPPLHSTTQIHFPKRSRANPACAGWARRLQDWATSCWRLLKHFIILLNWKKRNPTGKHFY